MTHRPPLIRIAALVLLVVTILLALWSGLMLMGVGVDPHYDALTPERTPLMTATLRFLAVIAIQGVGVIWLARAKRRWFPTLALVVVLIGLAAMLAVIGWWDWREWRAAHGVLIYQDLLGIELAGPGFGETSLFAIVGLVMIAVGWTSWFVAWLLHWPSDRGVAR